MQKRTKAETEKFYRGLLAEQRRSGLSIRAFAETRGVPAGTLSFWAHELRKRDAARGGKATGPTFVPVSVVDGPTFLAGSPKPAWPTRPTRPARPTPARGGYEVELGAGRVLRLPADFDEVRVAALVRAVTAC